MLQPRIIPVLLLQNGGLVKTVRFNNPNYIGDPINAVKIFNEKGADELVLIDLDACDKGKPAAKQGRKAAGLSREAAGLPNRRRGERCVL